MRIIAYTYDADYHCIDCTRKRFNHDILNCYYPDQLNDANGVPTIDLSLIDSEGNSVHPVFSTDEWQEYDASFLADNPTQYLACGDCHKVIEEYTHTWVETELEYANRISENNMRGILNK